MLKLENFDALKLSVASPEMILSWSHGEVTKPETINYRTLKPERDGLFCERIFGPVKDWECHCGKYKRYRYKGIICDKCGVEVTRSKVRRERMGHVKLASPVSHVWYFKGVPSRLGLLLDMSPRNLEKILYYANYVVTTIDEDARTEALKNYTLENHPRAKELREQIASGRTDEQVALEKKLVEREKKLAQERMQLDNTLDTRMHEIETGVADLQDRIRSGKGKKAAADFLLVEGQESLVAVEKGIELTEDLANKMASLGQDHIDTLRAQIGAQILEHEQKAGAELSTLREELETKTAGEVRQAQTDLDALKEEISASRDQLENLKVKDLLTDQQYRDYVEHFSKSFKAGMGATSVKILLSQIDLAKESAWLREESKSTSGQRRQKAIKRLRVIEAFRKSGTEPTWMIMDVLPVIPPDLRPMVQLDGGRFATSDLNDLYRRVINRNNRLKRLLELGAPEIIVRNERRMLQEAVDALIDNGRRGRAVTGTGNRKLKSLSDLLKGKQGRFRQNLLGKRVDYSGRSVIVVGPELKLHQCGLPKKMALELFKPFVMRELVNQGFTQNIKSAKRMVERVRPEVWDVLDQVIHEHPVLLNRAPTLHRLGIQAFMPVLVEGQAIQLHPLVCKAFNADFDGDQMAVHVPLFSGAVAEAKNLMMATQNVLLPSDGKPIIAPHQDIVLGNFWLTQETEPLPTDPEVVQRLKTFSSAVEASMAYDTKAIRLHDPIRVRLPKRVMVGTTELQAAPEGTQLVVTTVGRLIFNEALPLGERVTEGTERYLPSMVYKNQVMDVKKLVKLCKEVFDLHGAARTAHVANELKRLGFRFATQAGITVSAMDIRTPKEKYTLVAEGEKEIDEINLQYRRGLITENERYQKTVQVWTAVTAAVTKVTMESFDRFDSVSMMAQSGARGSEQQIRQIAGMRGLMADPTGRLIDLPIKANFSEGLTVLEYFISTHGTRKGLADTALRTADSGYLTRRLVDVAQDVIIRLEDCGTTDGVWVELEDPGQGDKVVERYSGRVAVNDIQLDGKTIVSAGQEIGNDTTPVIYENRDKIERIKVRSSMNCKAREGLCRLCYGRNLATGRMVEIGEAVGVIAAQSIGEPGTQLTMRTFHTGGVGTGVADITQGLPRVEELFEARIPKGKAIIAEIDGVVEIVREGNKPPKVKVMSRDVFDTNYQVASGSEIVVKDGDAVSEGTELVRGVDEEGSEIKIRARYSGNVKVAKGQITLRSIDEETREYALSTGMQLLVKDGDEIQAGDQLTDGSISPQELLLVRGKETVQSYLVREVQRVYRSQGVDINDKHIEIIVRQMLRKVRVEDAGDTSLLPGEIVSQFEWEEANAAALAEGGEPAIAATVLLGLIKAALNTASWLSAASFQETTRVLTEAAISGRIDRLRGLKENVIIGKLIPAGTGLDYYSKLREEAKRLYEEGLTTPPVEAVATESTDESADDSGETPSDDEEDSDLVESPENTEPAQTEEASAQTI